MLHLKTECQNKSRSVFIVTRVCWVVGIYKSRMVAMAELIVFAFSDNFSADNSKFSADSGIHGIHFLECMFQRKWETILHVGSLDC